MDDLDIYEDLDEFQEVQEKKSKELLAWETKYNESLQTIEDQNAQIKALNKKIKTMEVNFQNLLDTARAELNRKDKQLTELRKEKDDICFRRKPPSAYRDTHRQQTQPAYGIDRDAAASSSDTAVPAFAGPTQQTTSEVFVSKSTNPFADQKRSTADVVVSKSSNSVAEQSRNMAEVVLSKSSNPAFEEAPSRDPRDRLRGYERHSAHHDDASSSQKRRDHVSETYCSSSDRGGVRRKRDLGRSSERGDYKRERDLSSSSERGGGKRERDHGEREGRDRDRHDSRRPDYKSAGDKRDEERDFERSSRSNSANYKKHEVPKGHTAAQNSGIQKNYVNKEHTINQDKVKKISPKKVCSNQRENHLSIGKEAKSSLQKPQDEQHKSLPTAKYNIEEISHKSNTEAIEAGFEREKHTSQKEVMKSTEKSVEENFSKEREVSSKEDTQNSSKIDKELVQNEDLKRDLKRDQPVSTKTAEDINLKPIAKPKSTVEIKTNESDSLALVPKETEPSNFIESVSSSQDDAKLKYTKSATPQPSTVIDNKIPTPTAPDKSNSNSDVNSNYNQKVKLSTPRKVAIFNELFGRTPPSSAESGRSAASSKLLTNVMHILSANNSATTSPSAYTDDSEVETQNKPMPRVMNAVNAEAPCITSEEVNGYFTANSENSEFEEPKVHLPKESATKDSAKIQNKNAAKIATILPSLNAIFGKSEAKSIPALGDTNVNELQSSGGLWKKCSIDEQSEVIEIDDDTDVDVTSEEERQIPRSNSEKTEVAVALVLPAKAEGIELIDLSSEVVEKTSAENKTKKPHNTIIEKVECAEPTDVQLPKTNEKAADLSVETVETTQSKNNTEKPQIEIVAKKELKVTTAKKNAEELEDLSKETIKTSPTKYKNKKPRIEIVELKESEVQLPTPNEKAIELVGLSEETVETTQSKNKNKRARFEIVEKKECAAPTEDLLSQTKEEDVEIVDLSKETVETSTCKNITKIMPIEIVEKKLTAVLKDVPLSSTKDKAVKSVDLSKENAEMSPTKSKAKKARIEIVEKKESAEVSVDIANENTIEIVDLSHESAETSPTKNKTKKARVAIVEKKECAVPKDVQLPAENEKAVELVGLSEETAETTQARNKTKKAHIEIIENIRLPSLFELPNKLACGGLTNELRNVELNIVKDQNTNLDTDPTEAVTKKAAQEKIVKDPKGKVAVKAAPKNDIVLKVIDTIDITDDNETEIEKEQISESKIEPTFDETVRPANKVKDRTTEESLTEDLVTAEMKNESKENLAETEETNINETSEEKIVVSSNATENQETHLKSDKIVNIPEPNSLLDKVSLYKSETKCVTTVTEDTVAETMTGDIDEIPINATQQSVGQKVTIIEEKQLIEKDGMIYELTTTTEVAEKVTLVIDEIEVDDDELETQEVNDFAEIEHEMDKMHNTPNDKKKRRSNTKIEVEPTEVVNANKSEIIIAEEPPKAEHSKDEHKKKLQEATIVIDDDCEDVEELVNIANTANKRSTMFHEKNDNAAKVKKATQCEEKRPLKKTDSNSIKAEATSSQPETEDEISLALSQLRELQNSSETRHKPAAAKKKITPNDEVTEDAVAFVVNNCGEVSQADIPTVAIRKTPKKTKSPIKVENSTNSSKEQLNTSIEKPSNVDKQSESIIKPVKTATKKLAKCKDAERKLNQNEVKIILPKTKKALQKSQAETTAKPRQKVVPEIMPENKPVATKLQIIKQFKIPKKLNSSQNSAKLNDVAVNDAKEPILSKVDIALEEPKSASNVAEAEVEVTPESSSKVFTNTVQVVSTTLESPKVSEENLANATPKVTLDSTISNANKLIEAEVNTTLQIPDSTEDVKTAVKQPSNTEAPTTADDKNTPKKSHNKTENNVGAERPSSSFSPTTSNASTDDQIHKPKNYSLKRRILDSSSSDEDNKKNAAPQIVLAQKRISPKIATPKRELKRKRMSPSVKLIAETTLLEHETNLAKKPRVAYSTTTSPFTQRLDAVEIFHTDVTTAAPLPAMSPATTSQDAKFKEIDLRMQNMFQSPTHKVDDFLPEAADETFNSTIGLNDTQPPDITVEETIAQDTSVAESTTTTTTSALDTSLGGTKKRLSLGKRDYVVEKVSENVVNIFITRRRVKKRKPAAVATTALPSAATNDV